MRLFLCFATAVIFPVALFNAHILVMPALCIINHFTPKPGNKVSNAIGMIERREKLLLRREKCEMRKVEILAQNIWLQHAHSTLK